MEREEIIARLREERPIIAPSMLKCDYGNLKHEIERLERGGASLLHWDVMDGHFVPNLSYGAMVIKGLREFTSLIFDCHLMISGPARYLKDYLEAGADVVTVHVEAVPEPTKILREIRNAGKVAGLAVNPATPLSAVEPFLSECDLVLVMTVNPGFGGQRFMRDVLPKMSALRHATSEHLIAVDGGVAVETIQLCADAGADLFVAGSAVLDCDDYGKAIIDLRQRASRAARFFSSLGE